MTPDWQTNERAMITTLTFKDFKQACAFMTEIALYAEATQHHPDWHNVYNTVDIMLSTHDAGNRVTDKDRQLAKHINTVYARY